MGRDKTNSMLRSVLDEDLSGNNEWRAPSFSRAKNPLVAHY
jgi:hypothetical protein